MTSFKTFFYKSIKWIFFISIFIAIIAIIAGYFIFQQFQEELPDISQLHHVEYQVPLRIYSSDNVLLAQFGEKKRTPITIDAVPQPLINAFIAAEDDEFYSHPGVDFKGLIRAGIQLIITGKKKQGGSTITMQVTRNFLLSREKTFKRKFKEIILALRIEQEFSKDKILELYLNKIYLGHRSYGIAAASTTYYAKKLSELNLPQLAMLAGLPKAPSALNPISNPKKARQRRNYVLRRMYALKHITKAEFVHAVDQPITASRHLSRLPVSAPYITEMVRQKIYKQYGDKAYTLGLNVYTTVSSTLQAKANASVRSALHAYDKRHGYRALPHLNQASFPTTKFNTVGDTQSAQVITLQDNTASAKLKDNTIISLSFKNIKWARVFRARNSLGPQLKSITDILKPNDLIRVRQRSDKQWELAQIPEAEAALAALDASNGAILALSGGFDFFHSKYNRATQSKRQPGSGFKPIIYTTAIENGFTAASLINDAPIVMDTSSHDSEWRPENYSKKFFGMTPLRTALRKSRNLISIRLLRELGIKRVLSTAMRFGFTQNQLPHSLSLALGSGQATPLKMASIYSVFANGGFLIKPYFIQKIKNHKGAILFEAIPKIACPLCEPAELEDQKYAPRIISAQVNFLMNSLLRDVVQRGTGVKAKVLGRIDLAGKTGTTNEQRDAWFNGFSAGIATTTWLGFDSSKPLGRYETGGKAALPIWIDFMRMALENRPEEELISPEGIRQVFINPKTGRLAQPNSAGIWEFFREAFIPSSYSSLETETNSNDFIGEESLF